MSIIKQISQDEDELWKSCKYEIKVTIKFSNGVERELKPLQIAGMYLEKDFDTDHMPILFLDLALSKKDEMMVDSQTEFQVQIKQFYLEEKDGEKKDPKIFLNETFVRLNYGPTPNVSARVNDEIRKSNDNDDDDVAMEDIVTKTSYPLIKKEDFILSKNIVNANLVNVTQLDIFAWILQKAGNNKPFLISNFTNSNSMNEIVMLPKGMLETLIYMEREYGWHQEGTYLFMDYDVIYVTRMNGECTAWCKDEPKTLIFCVSEATSDENVPTGVLPKEDKVYYNIGVDQFTMSNASEISDQIEGNNIILINTTNGEPTDIQSGTSSYSPQGSYQARSYHGHNPYVSEQHKRRKQEQENQFRMTCINGDLGFLTPNKAIRMLTDVTEIVDKFKGKYRLASFKAVFIKNGDYFDNSTEIIIKRVFE